MKLSYSINNDEYNEIITKNVNINAISLRLINNNQVIVTNIVTTTYQNRLELIVKRFVQKFLHCVKKNQCGKSETKLLAS